MRYVRVGQPWLFILARRDEADSSPVVAAGGSARAESFQRAELIVGLVVGLGSVAITVPGTVKQLPPAAAVLLLPLVALVGYGLLIMAGRPRRGAALKPLPSDARRLVRRRTIGWSVVLVVAILIPLDWIWPLFIAGLIGLIYSIRQMRDHLSSGREPGAITCGRERSGWRRPSRGP